jgi:hypothetical protein
VLFNLDEERQTPVTLPTVRLRTVPDDTKEKAKLFLEARTLREGQAAWREIARGESFSNWKNIGAALALGKAHALRVTSANAAWGRSYSRAFGQWIKANGFDKMPPPTRSVAIELHENIASIERWRSTLQERQRQRLVHPLSVTRRWKAATTEAKKIDAQEIAAAAWSRFVACVNSLPPDVALPLWRAARDQADNCLGGA